jgi:hypothetical protein
MRGTATCCRKDTRLDRATKAPPDRRAPVRSGLSVSALTRLAGRPLAASRWRTAAPPLPTPTPTSSRPRSSRMSFAAATPRPPGAALEDGLAACREHCLERLDAVVGRLEEKVVNSGLGLFQLSDQSDGVPARWHRSAELWRHPVPARLPQDHELPLLGGLDEVLRPASAALAPPRPTAACWPCLRLEVLRCFHEIDEVDVGGLRAFRIRVARPLRECAEVCLQD